jgi:hypothetical protein
MAKLDSAPAPATSPRGFSAGREGCERGRLSGYRLTGGGPSGVLPGARELCPVAPTGMHVASSQFSNNGGTPPGTGIDFECDTDAERIANVLVEKNVGLCHHRQPCQSIRV